jgi:uncharacterized protein (DUF302 family)
MNLLYIRETTDSAEAVGARLEKAAAAHKFGVLGMIDLKEKMASRGVEFGPRCRIYEVCNPASAKRVLEKNMTVSTALPCRISVYEEGGKVKLATLLPTQVLGLFGSPEIAPVAQEVEREIKAIMDEAVAR